MMIHHLSYNHDERSILQAAVREYITHQREFMRYKPATGEDAFVTVRANQYENVKKAEALLERL